MSQDPLIGKQLANYRIEHRLGQGGMASVYYATDVNLHRPVAVKLIDSRYQGDPEISRRFVDEARLIARWRHENVIQVYYAGQDDDIFFFAMEYIEGMTLADLMDDYGASGELMPHPDVIKVGHTVAAALDYAHQQGVIHRDVKPANVMISFDDRVVLADFGLALDVERGTMGQIFGTPHYISPEQVRSSADVVPQSDIYALGVILFEMLTGSVPFDDPSAATLAMQHLTVPPPSPRSINPALNPAIEEVLLKSLEKEAGQRYQTGEALIDALEAAFEANESAPSSSLPLPPAAVAAVAKRNISRLSVSDKIALHLEQYPKTQPVPRPKADTQKTQIANENNTKPAKGISTGLLAASIIIVLLTVGIVGVALLGNNSGAATELPTLAMLNTDSTSVTGADNTSIPSNTVAPTTTPNDTPAQIAVVSSKIPVPTDTPLLTMVPSDTPEPTSTPSNTLAPSSTLTNTSQPTTAPSDTPLPTSTPINTLAPTDTTIPPTAFPLTATLTIMPVPAGNVLLLYDSVSFTLHNQAGETLSLEEVVFRSSSGEWVARNWGVSLHDRLPDDNCLRLRDINSGQRQPPAECGVLYGFQLVGAPAHFWAGVDAFEVERKGAVIARCVIADGECLIFVPIE